MKNRDFDRYRFPGRRPSAPRERHPDLGDVDRIPLETRLRGQKWERTNKPISITLGPEAKAAIDILKEHYETGMVSTTIDKALCELMEKLGYALQQEKTMFGDVSVCLVKDNLVMAKHSHQGQDFVEAPTSGTYKIRLQNNSGMRKLVVISVDGRNIMNGEEAGYEGSGYVLAPFQVCNIEGWRRTDSEVAAFTFVNLEDSYDKQMGGSGANVGVIGVAVFDEKPKNPVWVQKSTGGWDGIPWNGPITDLYSGGYSTSGATRGSSSGLYSTNGTLGNTAEPTLESAAVGTGYGERTEMKTVSTTFDRMAAPSAVLTLRYASRPMLVKWGVLKEQAIPSANPFPAQKVSTPAPPGWRG